MREQDITECMHTGLTSLRNFKKSILVQTEAPQKYLRPRHRSIWHGKSKSAVSFLFGRYLESYFEKKSNGTYTKNHTAGLISFHGELSVCGLGCVVALLVCLGIDSSCASTGGPIQMYGHEIWFWEKAHVLKNQTFKDLLYTLLFLNAQGESKEKQ